jgi:hypothetical protein
MKKVAVTRGRGSIGSHPTVLLDMGIKKFKELFKI